MRNTDLLGVLFCLLGLAAAIGAWHVFLDRAKPPVPNLPSPEEPKGILWIVLVVITLLTRDAYVGRRPDGPIGWLSTFVALVLISGVFLAGGFYLGLQ